VETDIDALDLRSAVTVTGYVDDDRMTAELAAADVVVNLRDPTSGETSGPLMRALGAGCCCVVTDVGTYSELPDDVVVKVRLDDMTPEGVALRLLQIVADPSFRQAFGRRGRAFVAATATAEVVARRYREVIEAASATPARQLADGPTRLRFSPRGDMLRLERSAERCGIAPGAPPLWWRERVLPTSDGGGRLLLVGGGDAEARLAEAGFGWSTVATIPTVPGRSLPAVLAAPAGFDGALLLLVDVEADDRDLVDFVAAVADRLGPAGWLTVEVAPRRDRPERLRAVLAARGFAVARDADRVTSPSLAPTGSEWTRGDLWCATFVPVRAAANVAPPAGAPS
jgi:hypothetical protein